MRLFREIGLISSTFLVIGNIIGIGIFTTSGLIAQEIGNTPWIIGVWLIGGFLALTGATCYSVLSVERPEAGGEYALLYPAYGPLVAFLAGWASLLIGFSAPIAASALGLSYYLLSFFSLPVAEGAMAPKIFAAATLLLVTTLLTLGLKIGSRIHSLITLLNLTLTVGFASVVLATSPDVENLNAIFSNNLSTQWSSFGTAVVMVMFAYSGWNATVYIAEEIRNPGRYIPGSLIVGTIAVIVAYVLMNLAYFNAVSVTQLSGKIAVAEITALASFGTQGKIVINILILFSILSSITAMSIAGPRVYFAMSRHRLFPGWLATVNARKKVPVKSIWFQSSVAFALIAFGTFRQILIYSGFILLLFSTLTVSSLLLKKNQGQSPIHFWFLYRILPAVFVLTNTVILFSAALSNPKETVAGAVTLALGLPVYLYYRRTRRRGDALQEPGV